MFLAINQEHQQTSASPMIDLIIAESCHFVLQVSRCYKKALCPVMNALSPSEADSVCQLASESTPAAAASFSDDACIAVL